MNALIRSMIVCRLFATKLARRLGLSRNLPSFLYVDFERILAKNYPAGSNFSFILVGAHDCISYDFIYDFILKRSSTGICIEPQPDIYLQLVKNTSFNPNIVTINKAVHATSKEVTLYRVKPQRLNELPEWASGIASFYPYHHQRSEVPSALMETIKVASDNFMTIINSHNFEGERDLLQIDTEGYDLEVLKMVDFGRVQPLIIKLEHVNLTSDELRCARTILNNKNYFCFCDSMDLIAVNIEKVRV
jgi:FkbM family methyltransferase